VSKDKLSNVLLPALSRKMYNLFISSPQKKRKYDDVEIPQSQSNVSKKVDCDKSLSD